MKKLFFTLALALSVVAVSAQSMWVGGTVGFSQSKVKGGDSEIDFLVMPEFGYILSDNLALGIALGGGHSDNYVYEGESVGNVNVYKVNPFVRYTFLKSTLGGLFVDGGLGYEQLKGCNGGGKIETYEVGFKPGVAVNLSSKFALIGKFGFVGYEHAKIGEAKADSFGLNFDLNNIQLGGAFKF